MTTDSMLCKICLKEEMEAVVVMCGHVFACIHCIVILDHCAICRKPAELVMRVKIYMNNNNGNDLSQGPDTSLIPMLCQICHEADMQALILSCKHIYACLNCALKSNKCLVCSQRYICIMQVYL